MLWWGEGGRGCDGEVMGEWPIYQNSIASLVIIAAVISTFYPNPVAAQRYPAFSRGTVTGFYENRNMRKMASVLQSIEQNEWKREQTAEEQRLPRKEKYDEDDGEVNMLHQDTKLDNNSVTEVFCSEGQVALLPCKFPQLSTLHQSFLLLQVSWLRRRDWHILTTGVYTYTSDVRFSVLHRDISDHWTLQIKYVKATDTGRYECQMYTGTGVVSQFVDLHVSMPRAAILGPRELHVQEGDTVTLVCIIHQGRPSWVFWYHGDEMVNYDNRLTVETNAEGERTYSRLTITHARRFDSGNYSCVPPNVDASSVIVYVSQTGDTVAAVQRQPAYNTASSCTVFPFTVLVSVLFMGVFSGPYS